MSDAESNPAVSNWQIMRALIAKDWRFFRVPMIALLITGTGCYTVAAVAIFFLHPDPREYELLCHSSVLAINLTGLLASVLGGMAIAVERSERTADFVGLLPVSRSQIVLSKWLVSIFMLGACAVINAVIALWLRSPGGFIS
jgi:ABC-type transport system involved in multi-copper enzyme maturation permease subunit